MTLSLQSDAADQTAASEAAATPPLTSLTAALLGQTPSLAHGPYCGAGTPTHFSGPATELDSILNRAAVFDLGYRSHIAVTGSDRFRWLNGMVTNTVSGLAPGEGNLSFVLSAQGRIQGDANIFRIPATHQLPDSLIPDSPILDTTRSQSAALVELLDRFIIMDDVELRSLDSELSAIGIAGPRATEILAAVGIAVSNLAPIHLQSATWQRQEITLVAAHSPLVPRFELWIAPDQLLPLWTALIAAGATPTGAGVIQQLRILEGTPLYGIDIRNRDLPHETAQTRALHFAKGCYVGQEIVERIRSRGNVHRIFSAFSLIPDITGEIPALPAPLTVAAQAVGELTSATRIQFSGIDRIFALGYIRREALDRASINTPDAESTIRYASGTAVPLKLPIQLTNTPSTPES